MKLNCRLSNEYNKAIMTPQIEVRWIRAVGSASASSLFLE